MLEEMDMRLKRPNKLNRLKRLTTKKAQLTKGYIAIKDTGHGTLEVGKWRLVN